MKRLNGNSPEVRRGTPLGRNGSDARKPRDTLKTRYGQVKLRNLDELDGRTAAAQKARAIVGRLVADAGGPDNITEGMRQLIQRAALLTLFVEDAEARWIAGETIELDEYLAAVNTQKRVLQCIGLERQARNVTPSLGALLRADRITEAAE